MNKPKLEMPSVSGKTVDSLTLHDDPLYGREITIRFTDETELSISIEVKQFASVRHFQISDDQTLFEWNEGAV